MTPTPTPGDGPTFGVMYRRERPPEELVGFARFVEASGLDELWIVEDCFWAAGPSAVSAALAATDSLTVGLGIAPAVARNPAIAAMEMAGIARLFPGRFVAGFGHGVADWMRQIGALPSSQLAAFGETVDAVRRLLSGDAVSVHGRYVHLDDVQLVFPPTLRPPVIAGVTGPKSIELSAKVADGLLLPEGSSADYVRAARSRMRRDAHCVVYVLFAVDDDASVAHAYVRDEIDRFAPGDVDERLRLMGRQVEVAIDARVARYAVAGTPTDCARSMELLCRAGATSVVVVPSAPDHEQQVTRLVTEVLPFVGP
jgi:5,10-methylenetetrahydromethanopterin reductase